MRRQLVLCRDWDGKIPEPGQDTLAVFRRNIIKPQEENGLYDKYFCGIRAAMHMTQSVVSIWLETHLFTAIDHLNLIIPD